MGNKNEYRSFCNNWYKDFPWLTMCTARNVVFCFYCKCCEEHGELTLSKNIEREMVTIIGRRQKAGLKYINQVGKLYLK